MTILHSIALDLLASLALGTPHVSAEVQHRPPSGNAPSRPPTLVPGEADARFPEDPRITAAVPKIRDYLERAGFDPSVFPARDAPKEGIDPLGLEIAWGEV